MAKRATPFTWLRDTSLELVTNAPNRRLGSHTRIKGRYFRSHYICVYLWEIPRHQWERHIRETESSCLDAPRCFLKHLSYPLIPVCQTNDGDQLPTVSEVSKHGFGVGGGGKRIFAFMFHSIHRENHSSITITQQHPSNPAYINQISQHVNYHTSPILLRRKYGDGSWTITTREHQTHLASCNWI